MNFYEHFQKIQAMKLKKNASRQVSMPVSSAGYCGIKILNKLKGNFKFYIIWLKIQIIMKFHDIDM